MDTPNEQASARYQAGFGPRRELMEIPNLSPSLSLEGKVALVVGGRRGMGRVIALTFAQAGADVAISDVVVEGGEMEIVTEEIRKLGRRSLAIQTDVTQKVQVDNMVQKVVDEFGAIDILVNNQNFETQGPVIERSEENWDNHIDIDLKGYFLCSQAAAKRMIERKKGGNIININSGSGINATPNDGVYSVAKAGAIMLTRVLALELASSNIRVNAIAPGITKTERLQGIWSNPELLKEWEARIPLGRMGERGDIASAALFLASEASSWVTGQTLSVDGGSVFSRGRKPGE